MRRGTKERHDREAHDLDADSRPAHAGCRGPECNGEDAHQQDRHRRLHEGGSEAEPEAFCQRPFVGHQIGGDDPLAVTRPGRVEDPVCKSDRKQGPNGGPLLLGRGERLLQAPVETALDRQNIRAEIAGRGRLAKAHAERIANGRGGRRCKPPREQRHRTGDKPDGACGKREPLPEPARRSPYTGDRLGAYGHATMALLANWVP